MSAVVKVPLSGEHGSGKFALVSLDEYEKVRGRSWFFTNGYAANKQLGRMHAYLEGPRPEGVPSSWVVDHKTRERLDNTKENRRWVSRPFNSWNAAKPGNSSKYRGVDAYRGKWRARLMQKAMGNHADERYAGRVVAKAAIREWGEWAATSDFLVGPDLFSPEEIQEIKDELLNEVEEAPVERDLPTGVTRSGKRFRAIHRGNWLGVFDTKEEAGAAYQLALKAYEKGLWDAHQALPVTLDEQGLAVVALSGQAGAGKFCKVPEDLWHEITFGCSWNLGNNCALATRKGKTTVMHQLVYKLLHPEFDGSCDVCHVNGDTFDNRACNLKLRPRS